VGVKMRSMHKQLLKVSNKPSKSYNYFLKQSSFKSTKHEKQYLKGI
jgi:hypothetical protein